MIIPPTSPFFEGELWGDNVPVVRLFYNGQLLKKVCKCFVKCRRKQSCQTFNQRSSNCPKGKIPEIVLRHFSDSASDKILISIVEK